MKLKPVPEKLIKKYIELNYDSQTTNTKKVYRVIEPNFEDLMEKLNEIIDYQDYLRERVQSLEDNRRNK